MGGKLGEEEEEFSVRPGRLERCGGTIEATLRF